MKEILITSSVLIAVLLLLRLIFAKKVSRVLIYSAWALVALRLLVPVQIGELRFSLLTAAQPVIEAVDQRVENVVLGTTPEVTYRDQMEHYIEKDQTVFVPQVQEQIRQELAHGNQTPGDIYDKIQQQFPEQEILTPEGQETVQMLVGMENATRLHNADTIVATIWLAGIAVMAIWFVIVNLRHSRKLRQNREKLDCKSPIPVYVSEKVGSPCLVGLFRPAVYLTPESAASEETMRHVLTHELTHYAHKDHIWSLMRCVCLCVYWFHPLVWVAAWFSRRDCELACDEGALSRLGEEERIAYGKTLLDVVSHAAAHGNLLQTATAMNETKKQLKERVNFIVKKPKLSIIAAICMVLVCAIITGCVAAGPTSGEVPADTDQTDVQTRSYIALKSVDDKLAIVYDDALILTEYSYDRDLTITCSMDGTSAVCLTEEGALLYIHDGSVEIIADHPVSYCLSVSGDALAFRIDTQTVPEATMESGLYLYQKQTGQVQQAASDADSYVRSYTLSPDGKTLAYVTTASFWEGTDSRLFVHRDGSSTLRMQFSADSAFEANRVYDLISINDSADIIYLYGAGRVFSIDMEGCVTKLGKTVSQPDDRGWSSFFFYNNADHSQLMFVNSYGTYLSTQGQKAAYISEAQLHPAERAYSHFRHDARYKRMSDEEAICVTCDFEDLSQQTMRNHNTLWYRDAQRFWYPNEDGEFVQVAAFELSAYGYKLDPSGTHVYYMDNERALYVLDLENGGQCTQLADKVHSYAVSYDCSTVYYYNEGLFICNGTEASQTQKEPLVLGVVAFCFSENNELFVKAARGDGLFDLFSISKDGKAELVLEDISVLTQEDCGMIYVTTEDGYYVVRAGELIRLQVKAME